MGTPNIVPRLDGEGSIGRVDKRWASAYIEKIVDSSNIIAYGAKGDGITDDSAALTAALTALGTDDATLHFPAGRYVLGADVTIPENICLKFDNGAVLSIGDTYTLTVDGNIDAGLWQIFGGAGAVTLAKRINARGEWFGYTYSDLIEDSGGKRLNINLLIEDNRKITFTDPRSGQIFYLHTVGANVMSGGQEYQGEQKIIRSKLNNRSPLMGSGLIIQHTGIRTVHGHEVMAWLSDEDATPGETVTEYAAFLSFLYNMVGGQTKYAYISHIFNDLKGEETQDGLTSSEKPYGVVGYYSEITDERGCYLSYAGAKAPSGSIGYEANAKKGEKEGITYYQIDSAYFAHGNAGYKNVFRCYGQGAINNVFSYNTDQEIPEAIADRVLNVGGKYKKGIVFNSLLSGLREAEIVTNKYFDVIYSATSESTPTPVLKSTDGFLALSGLNFSSVATLDLTDKIAGNHTVGIQNKTESVFLVPAVNVSGVGITGLYNVGAPVQNRIITLVGVGNSEHPSYANYVSLIRNSALRMKDAAFTLFPDSTITFLVMGTYAIELFRSSNSAS